MKYLPPNRRGTRLAAALALTAAASPPRSSNALLSRDPTNPAAPVTNTRIGGYSRRQRPADQAANYTPMAGGDEGGTRPVGGEGRGSAATPVASHGTVGAVADERMVWPSVMRLAATAPRGKDPPMHPFSAELFRRLLRSGCICCARSAPAEATRRRAG